MHKVNGTLTLISPEGMRMEGGAAEGGAHDVVVSALAHGHLVHVEQVEV